MKIDNALRAQLIALAACASPSPYHPNLATINFRKADAVATDQYILGMIPLEDGPKKSRLLPAKELAAGLRRVSKKDDCELDFGATEATLTVRTGSLFGASTRTMTMPYGGKKYPDVDSLIPTERGTKGDPPSFSASNLQRIAALSGKDGWRGAVRLHWREPEKPIVVTAMDDEDRVLGLVMPIRGDRR